jgi:antitoxin component of RelBE/YafQ-DinJ toxin-antitoxin module
MEAQIQIRVDKKIKKRYFKVCNEVGVNASGDMRRLIYERMRDLENDIARGKRNIDEG